MTVRHDGLEVTWLGYATARIEAADGYVVYVDPGRYGVLDDYDERDGDLVLVTHDHHYSSDGVERVAGADATLVVYEGVDADNIDRDVVEPESLDYEVTRIGESEELDVDGVRVRSLPAYNHPDGPHTREDGTPVHPRGFGVGFHLTVDGVPIFWPGDSDIVEEHEGLDVSLFLANIGGTVVMDRHECADLAERLDPDLTVPIHYDTFEMLETDSGAFAADVAGRSLPVALDERSANQ